MNRDQTAEEFNERFFTEKKSPKPPKKSEKVKQIMMDILWSLIFNVVHIIRLIVDKLVDISLEYYWGSNYLNCPPITKDKAFLMDSAVELARKIKNQQLTSYQVVSAFIDRMNQVNPVLNAVIHGPFMEALDEAKAIDERISKGEIGDAEFEEKQFLGVPFTTKDSNAVKDKLHTMGLVSRRNVIAKDDAEIVKLMKDAGAIIIATSSIPEWNKWQETRNNLIGQTNNPYDSRRTVGGSSGGEGALLAACATPIGLGLKILSYSR